MIGDPAIAARAHVPVHVLIVDDDALDRLAVRRCLHQSAIRASTDEAEDSAETLEKLRSGAYDCVLLDYYLPGVDGMTMLAEIRAIAPGTPIITFTGRGDEDIAVELMKAGVADYLPKASLTPERIASGIRYALSVRATESARRRAEGLLQLLNESAQHVLNATDPDELVRGLFERIREPLGVDAYLNYVVADGGDRLRLAASAGIAENRAPQYVDLSDDASRSAPAARITPSRAPLLEHDERMTQILNALGFKACSCHPLLADYELLGTLCFASRTKERFADDEADFLRSVSHYATAAYERLRRIGQLRQMDRRKDEFLATLAHELRNPLAPLNNMLELIKRTDRDPALIERAEATMSRQLRHLEQLVDDLLDVNRITQGKLQLRMHRVELAPLLDQAAEPAKLLAERARQQLTVTAPSEPIWVCADPVRLVQVFGNLLTNACKYTDDGGRIHIGAVRTGGEVVVTVKDDGIGIPTDQLRAVFEMFTQVRSEHGRAEGGLGIGLTLVKRLVEMHGGMIEARSEGLGRGSEFIVRLPVLDGPSVEQPAAAAASEVLGRRKILIVDDNRDSAMSLALLLDQLGHETRQAFDGPDALGAADEFRPDLILLDVGLPHLNGYEVCRRLRMQPWSDDVMIVALTGWGQDEDRRRSRDAGFDRHFVKPIGYTDLMELLAKHRDAANGLETAHSSDGDPSR